MENSNLQAVLKTYKDTASNTRTTANTYITWNAL